MLFFPSLHKARKEVTDYTSLAPYLVFALLPTSVSYVLLSAVLPSRKLRPFVPCSYLALAFDFFLLPVEAVEEEEEGPLVLLSAHSCTLFFPFASSSPGAISSPSLTVASFVFLLCLFTI